MANRWHFEHTHKPIENKKEDNDSLDMLHVLSPSCVVVENSFFFITLHFHITQSTKWHNAHMPSRVGWCGAAATNKSTKMLPVHSFFTPRYFKITIYYEERARASERTLFILWTVFIWFLYHSIGNGHHRMNADVRSNHNIVLIESIVSSSIGSSSNTKQSIQLY